MLSSLTFFNTMKEVDINKFTFEEFKWALSIVMSRQNQIPFEGKNLFALIPAWDMCNHTHGEITTFFVPEAQALDCYALKDTNVGEQLYIHYGPRSNAELFSYMGFVLNDNPYDSAKIFVPVPKDDTLFQRVTLLKPYNPTIIKGAVEVILRNHSSLNDFDTREIEKLNILAADKSQLVQLAAATKQEDKRTEISPAARLLLAKSINEAVARYPSTKASNKVIELLLETEKKVMSSILNMVNQSST